MANVVCEYIWLDADNHFRSKTKVLINHEIGSGFLYGIMMVLPLNKLLVNHPKYLLDLLK